MAAQGPGGPEAYITLLVSDNYLPGAMVLAHSLRDCGTKKLLVAMVTLDTVSSASVSELATVYDQILPVDRIANPTPANLFLMGRSDLDATFTKIALWRQTQFRRLVYVDADVVALRAPDELFLRDSEFAAAPDVGWPDCFNSGVMALTPNMGDYYALLALAQRGISFDGADQGLLNIHFREFDRFSFTYNCTPSASYQYVPAYRHFQSQVSLVHFIGRDKPWFMGREGGLGEGVHGELLGRWWSVFDKHYRYPTSGKAVSSKLVIQQYVAGEQFRDYNFHNPDSNQVPPPPPPTTSATFVGTEPTMELGQHAQHYEEPLMEPADPVEKLNRGEEVPVPTVEQRRFSAPQAEWNPTIEPPPVQSRPEAANFPTHTYTMSEDKSFFKAPKSYPEPPKDMWYEVPKTPPATEKPKHLFPWEATQSPPTRVFPESPPTSPPPLSSEPSLESGPGETIIETVVSTPPTATTDPSPITPTIQITPAVPFVPFSSYTRTNAWDDDPNITRYVEAFQALRRGNRSARPLSPTNQPATASGDRSITTTPFNTNATATNTNSTPVILSPTATLSARNRRKPSFKLTDFPSAQDRPSLPVTPAPITRPSFWGIDAVAVAGADGEEGEDGMPPAPGVPDAQDWDPVRKLEELRMRQEGVLGVGSVGEPRELPERKMPGRKTPVSVAGVELSGERKLGPAFGDDEEDNYGDEELGEESTMEGPGVGVDEGRVERERERVLSAGLAVGASESTKEIEDVPKVGESVVVEKRSNDVSL